MQNSMASVLKTLVAQVEKGLSAPSQATAPNNAERTVRIADVRRDAEEAKDALRHRLRS